MSTNTVPLKEAAASPKASGLDQSSNASGEAGQPTSIRYNRLSQISKRALQESFKHFTYEKLASCYPHISSTPAGKHALEQALIQITKFFNDTATEQFEAIYSERNVLPLMAELDELIEAARQRQAESKNASSKDPALGQDAPVNLDQLTPEAIIQAHLLPLQRAEEARLEEELAELKRENQALLDKLAAGNARAMELLNNLSRAVTDLQTTNKSTEHMPPRDQIVVSIQDMTRPSS